MSFSVQYNPNDDESEYLSGLASFITSADIKNLPKRTRTEMAASLNAISKNLADFVTNELYEKSIADGNSAKRGLTLLQEQLDKSQADLAAMASQLAVEHRDAQRTASELQIAQSEIDNLRDSLQRIRLDDPPAPKPVPVALPIIDAVALHKFTSEGAAISHSNEHSFPYCDSELIPMLPADESNPVLQLIRAKTQWWMSTWNRKIEKGIAGFAAISAAQPPLRTPLPSDLWKQIACNGYVDLGQFVDIVSGGYSTNSPSIRINESGRVESTASITSRPITSHLVWLACYRVYTAAVLFLYPERRAEFQYYDNHILEASLQFQFSFVATYDQYRRYAVAAQPARPLSVDNPSEWQRILLGGLRIEPEVVFDSSTPTRRRRFCQRWNYTEKSCPKNCDAGLHRCAVCNSPDHPASQCEDYVPSGRGGKGKGNKSEKSDQEKDQDQGGRSRNTKRRRQEDGSRG
jgi:hypothetical protein